MKVELLTEHDVETLTGRKWKRQQVEQLTKMNLPFVLNIVSRPLVPLSVIEGSKAQARTDIRILERYVDAIYRSIDPIPLGQVPAR